MTIENPAAFPGGQEGFGAYERVAPGMTLRDYFAGQALAGDMAAQNEFCGEFASDTKDEFFVARARMFYRVADAMLTVRNERTTDAE